MMKTKTRTVSLTQLVLSKPFTYKNAEGERVTLKRGHVLEERRNRWFHFSPWVHKLDIGRGKRKIRIGGAMTRVRWFDEIAVLNARTGGHIRTKTKKVPVYLR